MDFNALEAFGRSEHARLALLVDQMHQRALDIQPVAGGDLERADDITSTMPISHLTRFQLQVCANHLLVYTTAMRNEDHPTRYAGFSLLRGALEGAVTALWLQQPGTIAARTIRALRWTWWEKQDAVQFADEVSDAEHETLAPMLAALEADKRRVKSLQQNSIDCPRLSRTDMITEVQRRIPPLTQPTIMTAWRQTSSLAHGNSIVASMSFVLTPMEGAHERQRYATASWSVASALLRTACSAFDLAADLFERRASESS